MGIRLSVGFHNIDVGGCISRRKVCIYIPLLKIKVETAWRSDMCSFIIRNDVFYSLKKSPICSCRYRDAVYSEAVSVPTIRAAGPLMGPFRALFSEASSPQELFLQVSSLPVLCCEALGDGKPREKRGSNSNKVTACDHIIHAGRPRLMSLKEA